MQRKALQLYTIKELCEKDFIGTLKNVAQWGYEGAQFAGFYDTPASQLKNTLSELGLKPAGSHTGLDQLKDDELKRQIEYSHEIGNELIILAYLTEENRRNLDDYKRVADTLNKAGDLLKSEGMKVGYHNHDFEFEKQDALTGYEVLLSETDPSLVSFELDVYWAAYKGYDVVQFMETLRNRLVTLHVKDMAVKGAERKSTIFGTGELDLASIVSKGKEMDVSWFVVEQEHFETDLETAAKENVIVLQDLLKQKV
ncbi:sugar phosphate isomerase/epimerase family protein [Fictibacillus fluitans]|uniref:Sugar phosphate isomerase/epimerase n=1 Tax=Fictibacillus fluitans TaxID=3058422 RepID=A0ABT8HUR0_9BACL|nr:sugar phosphate isomerase/epimerase [Fictibacillus sp. NE201]MDN4524483.1 sugar phosphate isomerase/epimerase [Fictibacillus sp. NE201]